MTLFRSSLPAVASLIAMMAVASCSLAEGGTATAGPTELQDSWHPSRTTELAGLSGFDSSQATWDQESLGALENGMQASQASYSGSESRGLESPYGDIDIGNPTVRVTGFFQTDAGWFYQDQANREALVNGVPLGNVADGADFRRTRLAAVGNIADNMGYLIEVDFAAPGRPSLMDVYMDIRDLPVLGTLRIGQWRQPFSMDAITSVRELIFLERALPFAFVPFRQIGVGFFDQSANERITWAVSTFRYPTDVYGGNVGDQGGYGMTSRVTMLPIEPCEDVLVHLGANYSYADPSYNLLRFRNQPEFFVSEVTGGLVPDGLLTNVPPFVDTGLLRNSQSYSLAGLEAATRIGRLTLQSEAMIMNVNRNMSRQLTFPGVYAQMAYVLTGETRPYNRKSGVFGRIVPERPLHRCVGWGACEVTARWSYLDLNDADITGNRLNDLTFGFNWYLNKNAKFQLNYIHAMLDSSPDVDSRAGILAVRAQVDF